MFQIILRTK